MALLKCKECGTEVSSQANACPRCGIANPGNRRKLSGCLRSVLILVGVGAVLSIVANISRYSENAGKQDEPKSEAPSKPADPAAEEHARHLQMAVTVVQALKRSMRNPDRFKVDQVLLMKSGALCLRYRGENGFGGMDVERAVVSHNGKKALTSPDDGFSSLWNHECAEKTGSNIVDEVEYWIERLQ